MSDYALTVVILALVAIVGICHGKNAKMVGKPNGEVSLNVTNDTEKPVATPRRNRKK